MAVDNNENKLNELNDVLVQINRRTLQKGFYGPVEVKWFVKDGSICNVVGNASQIFKSLDQGANPG